MSHTQTKPLVVAILTVMVCMAWTAAQAADIRMAVRANRSQVYLGESFDLTIRVTGTDRGPAPSLGTLTNCRVRFLGDHKDSRLDFTIRNGRMTQIQHVGRSYVYRITPDAPGSFRAGPISLNVKPRLLSYPGPVVKVIGIEAQNHVLISLTSSRDTVLVGEPFEVTLSVFMKRLKGQYANAHPIDPANPPHLQVDYLNLVGIRGLDHADIKDILGKKLTRRPHEAGFRLNGYVLQGSPFNIGSFLNFGSLDESTPARFLFDVRLARKSNQDYQEYTVKTTYTPKEERSYTFGPAVFKGQIVTAVDAAGHLTAQPIFAVGPAATVRVIPPPEAGRPASYVGIIGSQMTVQATLDAQTCNVGDPLTLTLRISGDVNMLNAYPLRLSTIDALTKDFRTYDDSVQSESGKKHKTYQYRIRPTRAGTLEIPPLAFSYFDTGTREYRTVYTQPIPVRANASPELRPDDIIGTSGDQIRLGMAPGSADRFVPAPLDMARTGYSSTALSPQPWQLILASACPVSYLLLLIGLTLRRRSRQRESETRRQRALSHATTILNACAPGDGSAVCNAMRQYIADRFDVSAPGLTPSDVRRVLDSHDMAQDLVARICDLMSRSFDASYSGGAADSSLDDLAQQARQLLKEANRAEPKPSHASASRTLMLALILAVGAGPLQAMDRSGDEFSWHEAYAHLSTAQTPADFQRAAQSYRGLVDRGVRSGPLFYNLGTAHLLAEEYNEAVAALTRAERYLGCTWEVRRNLLLAYAGLEKNIAASLPWYRLPLFWHYRLSLKSRYTVAITAFCLLWLALLLRTFRLQRTGKALLALSMAGLILFGSSVLATLFEESKADRNVLATRIQQSPQPLTEEPSS